MMTLCKDWNAWTAGPAALLALSLITGCDDEGEEAAEAPAAEAAEPEQPAEPPEGTFEPLPESVDVEEQKVLLGRSLYFDTRLSGDETLSCATCHMLDHGGAEPRPVSTGIRGQQGPINAPTVLNSRFNVAQFWDGRAEDLVEQAMGPVANPIEMGADWPEVVERIRADEQYRERFEALYEDGVTKENIADAIAEYEESLITPAPFDRFLRGDEDALTAEQRQGYRLFHEVGCTTCHEGVILGGTSYQKLGLVNDYFGTLDRELTDADMGRFNVTENVEDRHKFKVPTLRNVEHTAPYFHDGSVESLERAVRLMGHHQLGRDLSDEQVAKIVAFLESLSGELPEHALPPSGEQAEGEAEGEAGGEAGGATEAAAGGGAAAATDEG